MAKKSTIVPKLMIGAIVMGLSILQRVSVRAASALAERLWFRSGKPPSLAARDRRGAPDGEPFEFTHGESTITGRLWGDANSPTAYLVHGWGGWWQQLGAFIPLLRQHGYRVVAFDALAHGESGPGALGRRSTHIPELARSFEAVVGAFGAPAVTIAHSIGCVVVNWSQRSGGASIGHQVLIAPAVTTAHMVDTFAAELRLGERTRSSLVRRIESRVGRVLHEFDLIPPAEAGSARSRVLIVHDRDDTRTPVAESEALAERWPGAHLRVTRALGHYRVLRAEPALSAVTQFLSAVSSPAGAGRA